MGGVGNNIPGSQTKTSATDPIPSGLLGALKEGTNITLTEVTEPSGDKRVLIDAAGAGFTGSGTTDTIVRFTGPTALGDSAIRQSGSSIGVNVSGSILATLHAEGTGVFSVRTSNSTNAQFTGGSIMHKTSADMTQNFGVNFELFLEDATSGIVNGGELSVVRQAVDNTSILQLASYTVGAKKIGLVLNDGNTLAPTAIAGGAGASDNLDIKPNINGAPASGELRFGLTAVNSVYDAFNARWALGLSAATAGETLQVGGRTALLATTAPAAFASYGKIYVDATDSDFPHYVFPSGSGGSNEQIILASATQTITGKTMNTASNTFVLDAADTTTGTFLDARISLSSVTQHINDAGTGVTDIWSANKITSEITLAKNDFDFKNSVKTSTAAALPANTRSGNVLTADVNAAFGTIDGVTINTDGTAGAADGTEAGSDHILVKNEGTGANNGIYFLSDPGDGSNPWKLTRRSDADTSSEVTAGLYVFADQGTVNANTAWVITTDDPITLNTTALVFGKYSGLGQITAGAGLTKTGDTIDIVGTADRIIVNADSIDIASTYIGQATITTLGTIATGTWEGTTIAVDQGGTGQTSYVNGQLLIGNTTGNTLSKATLTEGEAIDITNSTGSITISCEDASVTNKGVLEISTVAEINSSTASLAMTPDLYKDSNLGRAKIAVSIFGTETAVAVVAIGTDDLPSFPVPIELNGWELIDVIATVTDKGVTGTTTVNVNRRRAGVNVAMLSTGVTLGDEWFARDGSVDATNDDLATGDEITPYVTGIHTTPPNGLFVTYTFRQP